jgi:uncharacterized protein YnzC (UPF0291/DUF896 family)
MSYNYKKQMEEITAEDAMRAMAEALEVISEFKNQGRKYLEAVEIINTSGDTWDKLACIDNLVEQKRLIEITSTNSSSLVGDRIFKI